MRDFTIDRHVPLALVFTLLLQAATAVWWASAKDAQDVARDRRLNEAEQRIVHNDTRQIDIIERLARLEAHAENQNTLLRQIAGQLGRKMNGSDGMRRINEAGLALIKKHEGLRLKAYLCPAGRLTIGYGHTRGVAAGDVITPEIAERLLMEDVSVFEKGVAGLTRVPLNDNQFAALVAFSFNVGLQAFYRSALLNLLNRGWYAQVPVQLSRWTKARGQELKGLVRRRGDEAALWNRGEE